MKAVITVVSPDKVGIIASVTSLLASMDVNILDLSQTIMDGVFTMTLMVDTSTSRMEFGDVKSALVEKGKAEGLSIHIQSADIFTAMHRI